MADDMRFILRRMHDGVLKARYCPQQKFNVRDRTRSPERQINPPEEDFLGYGRLRGVFRRHADCQEGE